MSKKKKYPKTKTDLPAASQQPRWLWAVAIAAILLVGGGLTVLLIAKPGATESGAPKVAVDRTVVDEGYQKLDTPVRTAFKISNEGTALLQILGEPQVKLVEGC